MGVDGWMVVGWVDGGWMGLKNPPPNENSSIILFSFPLPTTAETPAISIQQLNEMPRQG